MAIIESDADVQSSTPFEQDVAATQQYLDSQASRGSEAV